MEKAGEVCDLAHRSPEWALLLWALPLNAAWEFAQSPLYADWNRDWPYLIWTRLHCTAGDGFILLGAFWFTSLAFRTRHWIGTRRGADALFIAAGFGYTLWSEWYNTSVRASWGYSANMPLIIGIGLAPILQWTLLPPLALRLLRRSESRRAPRDGAPA
ncbi:MAG: hypothetical protein R2752_13280 [Vicinamibacterales bacterium]